jgi:crotonobetainyl-CoA:carnitine CoA-transferase CaiB-like acyl-CoA transferase
MGSLSGIRVLDLSRLLPGPLCTLLLADHGADVIKIEEPESGDFARYAPPQLSGVSGLHILLNRNKRSLTLNLKASQGREIFYRLLETADVVVESFQVGVTKRLGVDYDSVRSKNERVVYCSISSYGQKGPYSELPAHDLNVVSIAGITDLTGFPNGPPAISPVQTADTSAGILSAFAIMCALRERETTGKGSYLDISLLEGAFVNLVYVLSQFIVDARTPTRGRTTLTGNVAWYNIYRCSDGEYVSVCAVEKQFWDGLCAMLKCPEFVPEQYASVERQANMREAFAERFESKTSEEWFRIAAGMGLPIAPVYNFSKAILDQHVTLRRILSETEFGGKKIRVLTPPLGRAEGKSYIEYLPAAALGEHTKSILSELGYSDDDYRGLKEAGAV